MSLNRSIMAGSPATLEKPAAAKITARATLGSQVRRVITGELAVVAVVGAVICPPLSGSRSSSDLRPLGNSSRAAGVSCSSPLSNRARGEQVAQDGGDRGGRTAEKRFEGRVG